MKLLPVKLWESLPIGLYGILCASSWVRLRQERKTVWQHQRSSVLLSQQHAAQRKQSSSCLSSVGKATEPVFLNKLKALKRENLLFFSFLFPRHVVGPSRVRCVIAAGRWRLEDAAVSAWRPLNWATLRRFHLHDDSNQQPQSERRPHAVSHKQWHHPASGLTVKIKHSQEHAAFEECELPK